MSEQDEMKAMDALIEATVVLNSMRNTDIESLDAQEKGKLRYYLTKMETQLEDLLKKID